MNTVANSIADLFLSDLPDADKAELAEQYAEAAESDDERDAWRALAIQYSLAASDQARGHNSTTEDELHGHYET